MCKCFITYRGANAPYKNHSKARNGISVFVVNQFMLIILLLDLHLCTFLCRARSWSCLFYAGFMFVDDPWKHKQGIVASVFHS